MNFTLGIIIAVGVLVAFSLVMIAMDPGFLSTPVEKPTVPEPVVCTRDYNPVCGVDGITYSNQCMLDGEKVKLDHPGECVPVKPLQDGWTRLSSSQHAGAGHESHQSVTILPISDKVYSGTLQYDASEPIQLITLHGPLSAGEDKGQATWSPDGVAKYALTFVDQKSAKGEWMFAGNALVVHTKNPTQFSVDYNLGFTKPLAEIVKSGTISSEQDPGLGHESHQIAILLSSSTNVYSGVVSYSASEPIQLLTLRGPLGPTEKPAATWTADGQTQYALNLFDPANSMGSWDFSGNTLAIHTKNTTQFTVSYSLSATNSTMAPIPIITEPVGPMNHKVSIPQGVASPGCESTKECYLPDSLAIKVHDSVTWSNDDTAAHTVSSGTVTGGIDGIFDSGLFMAGATFGYTFDNPGEYPYLCMVHPWMTGTITVS